MQSLTLVPLLVRTLLPSVSGAGSDRIEVLTTFSDYVEAAVRGDGAKVTSLLSRETFEQYDRYRRLALRASKEELLRLTSYDCFSALHLRHRLSAKELENLTPEEILRKAYEQGWNSKRALETVASLGDALVKEIEFSGDGATVNLKIGEQRVPPPFRLKKEATGWKMDMASMFTVLNDNLDRAIATSGKPRDVFVVKMLEDATGKKAAAEIWDPPKSP